MKKTLTFLAGLLLAIATPVAAQVTAPSAVVAGSNPPVSVAGHEPGESVSLHVYYDDTIYSDSPAQQVYRATAGADGVAHFRPYIRDKFIVGFTDGPATSWQDMTTRIIVQPEAILGETFWFLVLSILDEGAQTTYVVQHVEEGGGGIIFDLIEDASGFTVVYP